MESLLLNKTSFLDWNPWGRAKWPLFSILGSGLVFTYLILTSSLEARAIALVLSPGNIRTAFPASELGVGWQIAEGTKHLELKSLLSDRPGPNPAPDAASIGSWDGIYLYGESPKPDEIKKAAHQDEVWGK